jgi:four helix bundle protein
MKMGGKHPTSNIQRPTSNGGSGARTGDGVAARGEHPAPKGEHLPRQARDLEPVETPTSNEESRKRRFDLEERMLAHAGRIVDLYDAIPAGSGARQVGNQLVRSGTSPYLHHGEVEAAESLDDFIHKLKVCLKELRETRRALRLLQRNPQFSDSTEIESLIDETHQLIRIFFQSVGTARQRKEPSSRIREDAPAEDHWMLSVGCWMLDVEALDVEAFSEDRR